MKNLLFLFGLSLFPLLAVAQWQQVTASRGTNNTDMAMIDGQVWLATRSGILVSPDFGLTWQQHDWFTKDSTVWSIKTAGDTVALVSNKEFAYTLHFRAGRDKTWESRPIYSAEAPIIVHLDKTKIILMTNSEFIYYRFSNDSYYPYLIPSAWPSEHPQLLGHTGTHITYQMIGYQDSTLHAIPVANLTAVFTSLGIIPHTVFNLLYGDGQEMIHMSASGVLMHRYSTATNFVPVGILTSEKLWFGMEKLSFDEYAIYGDHGLGIYNSTLRTVDFIDVVDARKLVALPAGGYLSLGGTNVYYLKNLLGTQSVQNAPEIRIKGLYDKFAGEIIVSTNGELVSQNNTHISDFYQPYIDTVQAIPLGPGYLSEGGSNSPIAFSKAGYGFYNPGTTLHKFDPQTRKWSRMASNPAIWTDQMYVIDSSIVMRSSAQTKISHDLGLTWQSADSIAPQWATKLPNGEWVGLGVWNNKCYTSSTRGHTWQVKSILPIPYMTAPIDQSWADTIFATGSRAFVWSADGGTSWQGRGLPFLAHPTLDTVFAELAIAHQPYLIAKLRGHGPNDQLLASIDLGVTWYNITGNLDQREYIYDLAHDTIGNILYCAPFKGLWRLDLDDLQLTGPTLAGSPFWHGQAYVDQNHNGQRDQNEQPATQVSSFTSNNGHLAHSDQLGRLLFLSSALNTDQMHHVSYGSKFDTVAPAFHLKQDITDSFLVAVKPYDATLNGDIHDLCIEATLQDPPRPGFSNKLIVEVRNHGTAPDNGRVRVVLPTEFLLNSTDPTPVLQSADSVVFTFTNLPAGQSKYFTLNLTVSLAAQLGQTVSVAAQVEPFDDYDPLCNSTSERYEIIGSFDPNDKASNLNGYYHPDSLAARVPVDFTIRFENIGTYYAETVKVIDTIQDAAFDLSTFRFVTSSHPCTVTFKDRNIIIFTFHNIRLDWQKPDNQGFVRFEIAPHAHLPIGAELTNRAEIFFDYNTPIVTNLVQDVVNTPPTSAVPHLPQTGDLDMPRLSPNPASDMLRVQLDPRQQVRQSQIFDAKGARVQLKSIQTHAEVITIDVSQLVSGVYTLELESANQIVRKKFVVLR